MNYHVGAREKRQLQVAIGYWAANIVGNLFLDVFFHHLQIDQTGGEYYKDNDQEDQNQQAFDQPAEYLIVFAHRGTSKSDDRCC